jgi:hypothetical protein
VAATTLETACDANHFSFHGNAFNPDTGQLADYPELSRSSDGNLWQASNIEEIARLAQGYGTTAGTNTMFFIRVDQIPKDRKPTYLRIVSAFRPEKDNPRRVRWTCGGDKVDYPGSVTTKTAELITVKCLLNSVISTPLAKFLTMDLKDFYLGTNLSRYEYMRIPISIIPAEIIQEYQLEPLIYKGYVYVEIRKGIFGLPQAGRLANDRLVAFSSPTATLPSLSRPAYGNTKPGIYILVSWLTI